MEEIKNSSGELGKFSLIYDKMFDNKVVTYNPTYCSLWVYLVCQSFHKEKTVKFKGKDIILQEGQIIVTYDKLTKICKFGITFNTVRDALKAFENENMIEKESSNKGTLITIKNWDKYHQRTKKSMSGEKGQHGTCFNKNNAGELPTTYTNAGYGSTTKANTNKFNKGIERQDYNIGDIENSLINQQINQSHSDDNNDGRAESD